MIIELYKCSAEFNRVDKTDFITRIATVKGTLRDGCSITSPVITIEYFDDPSDDPPEIIHNYNKFNYVYITQFNRYYFVADIVWESNTLLTMYLDVDVLMTYKTGIKNLTAFVSRNENDFNGKIIDNKRPVEQGVDVTVLDVPNVVFYPDNNSGFTQSGPNFVITGYKFTTNPM